MHAINVDVYFMADTSDNCPRINTIIDKETECKDAASHLGLSYVSNTHSTQRPAGCFWHFPITPPERKVYFNDIIDPSQTDNNGFGQRGGICTTRGKHLSYYT